MKNFIENVEAFLLVFSVICFFVLIFLSIYFDTQVKLVAIEAYPQAPERFLQCMKLLEK